MEDKNILIDSDVIIDFLRNKNKPTGDGAVILNPAVGGMKNLLQKEKGKCGAVQKVKNTE